jgi:hypothetical protein
VPGRRRGLWVSLIGRRVTSGEDASHQRAYLASFSGVRREIAEANAAAQREAALADAGDLDGAAGESDRVSADVERARVLVARIQPPAMLKRATGRSGERSGSALA